jgi:hypothetical protein
MFSVFYPPLSYVKVPISALDIKSPSSLSMNMATGSVETEEPVDENFGTPASIQYTPPSPNGCFEADTSFVQTSRKISENSLPRAGKLS